MRRPVIPTPLAVGIAAMVLLSAAGCQKGPDDTRFLNFDAESSTGALVSGWSGFEKMETGDTFSWVQSRQAKLLVQARRREDRLVRFRCWAFAWDGAPQQVATLFVNETKIDAVPLTGAAKVYSLPTPAAAWKDGPNEIRFEFTYAEAPKDRIPSFTDERTLSAAFDWLEIVPPLPPEPKK